MFGEIEIVSSHEGDEGKEEDKEEVENDSPCKLRRRKMTDPRNRRGGTKEGEDYPLCQFGLRVRTRPQEGPQGEDPGRFVSI